MSHTETNFSPLKEAPMEQSYYPTIGVRVLLPSAGEFLKRMTHRPYKGTFDLPAQEPLLEEFGNFSPATLLTDLTTAEYELVNVVSEYWQTGKKHRYAAQFIFSHRNAQVAVLPWFARMRRGLEIELEEILQDAIWRRIRVFSNPIIEDGEEVEKMFAASIILDQRHPFYSYDGEPGIMPIIDETGNKVGGEIAVEAEHLFRFTASTLHFEDAVVGQHNP